MNWQKARDGVMRKMVQGLCVKMAIREWHTQEIQHECRFQCLFLSARHIPSTPNQQINARVLSMLYVSVRRYHTCR